jgi:hypothetical protein
LRVQAKSIRSAKSVVLDWRGEADKPEDAKQQIGLSGGDLGGLFLFLLAARAPFVVDLLVSVQSAELADFQAS